MLSVKEAIKIIQTEKSCVIRNINNQCDRDCAKCDLLKPDEDILASYDIAIDAMDKQVSIPTEEVRTAMNRFLEYCPKCDAKISNYVGIQPKYCGNCGQKLAY